MDVTVDFLKTEGDYVALFEWLNDKGKIDQKSFLANPAFGIKKVAEQYRWNYVEDKSYPCNETRSLILSLLEKTEIPTSFYQKREEEKRRCGIFFIQSKISKKSLKH